MILEDTGGQGRHTVGSGNAHTPAGACPGRAAGKWESPHSLQALGAEVGKPTIRSYHTGSTPRNSDKEISRDPVSTNNTTKNKNKNENNTEIVEGKQQNHNTKQEHNGAKISQENQKI